MLYNPRHFGISQYEREIPVGVLLTSTSPFTSSTDSADKFVTSSERRLLHFLCDLPVHVFGMDFHPSTRNILVVEPDMVLFLYLSELLLHHLSYFRMSNGKYFGSGKDAFPIPL